MKRDRLVVVSSPSGGGKTTICRELQKHHPDWRFSVSATTRPRRVDERDGEAYYFLTDLEFDDRMAQGELIEWEWVHGHRYGTLRSVIEEALTTGVTLLLDIDVRGGLNIKKQYPRDTIAIFIDPPDIDTLIERLRNRGTEDASTIEKRLSRIPEEQAFRKDFDHVVINDDLDRAVSEIESILESKR
jgi:guanylate kinase